MLTPSLRSHSAAKSFRRVLKPESEPDLNFTSWRYSQRNRRTGNGFSSFACYSPSVPSFHVPQRRDRNDDEFRSGWWKGGKERCELATPVNFQLSRSYHTSPANERAVAIMLGLGAVSAASYGAAAAVKAYNEYKASLPDVPAPEELQKESTDNGKVDASANQGELKADEPKGKAPQRENIFVKWFNLETGYYEGGFEETMTKQEAALILGVRQSSSARRIKDAHRKLLILNHPDTGGSTYLAGKINEAKEIMLKGKRGEK